MEKESLTTSRKKIANSIPHEFSLKSEELFYFTSVSFFRFSLSFFPTYGTFS